MSVPANASANATLSGAREARTSLLGRLVAGAAARDLSAFVVPGPEVARARGLDLRAAGLGFSPTPRHASVLVVVGRLPEALAEAAAVAHAQMPRPRAVFAVGAEYVSHLPGPDVSVEANQDALDSGVAELRRLFAKGAFDPEAESFEAAALRSRTEYACPMHPEVVQDEPGACPKCGMDLVTRETSRGNEGPADRGHGGNDHAHHGRMDQDEGTGEGHGHETHDSMNHGDHEGMNHGDVEHGGHEGMSHGGMDHGGMGFMSMVEMTEGTPRSSDGLQMEWVETPLGPLFPGLPGGLSLTFTLDGDTVAGSEAGSTVGARAWENLNGPVEAFVERLASLDPLSPVSYRLLALRAVESAAATRVDKVVAVARVGALERERAAGHLNWLAGFGYLIGYSWLARRAEDLQLALLRADVAGTAVVRAGVRKLARRVERTPLLRRKLAGVGKVAADLDGATGPVARAGGRRIDARMEEETYRSLGFEPVVMEGDDALARLRVRMVETEWSLGLVGDAGASVVPPGLPSGLPEAGAAGGGTATVETPRGTARLAVTLDGGRVTVAQMETPSTRHLGLVKPVTEQRELGDALVGVASLDLSPWEVLR